MAFSYPFFYPHREPTSPLDGGILSLLLPSSGLLDSNPSVHRHFIIRPRPQQNVDSSGKVTTASSDSSKFQVFLNVKHFKPEELTVKTVDDYIVIHGKHEMDADEHGFVSREFTRRYAIPEDVERDKIQSSLSQDGILTVQAPRKVSSPPPNERVIPISIVRTPLVSEKPQEQPLQQEQPQQKEEQEEKKSES